MNWKDNFPKENRYFETENGILYVGDSNKILNKIPKESIDLVLTDPPYNIADNNKLTEIGTTIQTNKDAWGSKFKDKWNSAEEYYEWLFKYISRIKGVLTDNGQFITFFDRKYTGLLIYHIESKFGMKFKNKLYFEKHNPLPNFRKNNYRSCIEEAIWFVKSKKSKTKINFISQNGMKQIFKGNIGKKFTRHPTEKYGWMIIPIIQRHSQETEIVLDPFLGSGTTAVACEELGRRWIGIELNPEYCEIAKQRIVSSINQSKLMWGEYK